LWFVIRFCEKRNIMQQSHADKTSAYLGVSETLARIKEKFYPFFILRSLHWDHKDLITYPWFLTLWKGGRLFLLNQLRTFTKSWSLACNSRISIDASPSYGSIVGVRETLARIKQTFYWPGIRKDVRSYVVSCEPCNKRKCLLQKNRDLMKRQALGCPVRRCNSPKLFENREQGIQPHEYLNTHKVINVRRTHKIIMTSWWLPLCTCHPTQEINCHLQTTVHKQIIRYALSSISIYIFNFFSSGSSNYFLWLLGG
jgi:hypothetical protein